jgi:hyperosmotically inducible periplasmic protein
MRHIFKTVPLTLALGLLAFTLACGDSRDARVDYEDRVNEQLKAAELDNKVNVNWNNDERVLRLTGEVDRETDKARAEELAQQVVGTSGRVVNEVKVEGQDYGRADDRIEEQLNRIFEDRTEWDFDGRGVSFDSEQGVVTITGTVESEATKQKIAERARATAGVKDVVNNLDVDPKRRTTDRR